MARTKSKTRAGKRGSKTSNRKSTIKAAARKNKAAKGSGNAALIRKLEKDLLQAPGKIAAQIDKDIKSLKQNENKLKASANKNAKQVKAAEGKLMAADQKSHTTTGKKRLKVAQKKHAAVIKAQQTLNDQLDAIAHTIAATQDQQDKFKALAKQLTQFNKDWANNAKNKASTASAGGKTKKRAKKDVEIPNNIATIERSQADEVQTLFDDISLDESTDEAVG